MYQDRIGMAIALALGAMATVLFVVGVVVDPVAIFVALALGAAAVLVYYHESGAMAARLYERVERRAKQGRGGTRGRDGARGRGEGRRRRRGAGPRPDWTPPRGGSTAREAAAGDGGAREASARRSTARNGQRGRRGWDRSSRPTGGEASTPTAAQAYRRLDLEPGADEAAIRRAYRSKVKEVHPDTEGGDERAFKRVTAAYERLTE